MQSSSALRKPLAVRKYNNHLLDETDDFRRHDTIKNITNLNDNFCLAGFSFKRTDNRVLYLLILFYMGMLLLTLRILQLIKTYI